MNEKKAYQILMDIQSDWEDGEEYEAFNMALIALENRRVELLGKEKEITVKYLEMCKNDLVKISKWMINKQSDISVLVSKIKAIDFILEDLEE